MNDPLLDIEVDGLTNSIQNTVSGDSFDTEVSEVTKTDLTNITKTNNWKFDWKMELKESDRQVYKLTITGNPAIIQGLGFVSFQSKTKLIEHYELSLGATHVGGHKMVIFPMAALKLIKQYFKT